MDEQATLDDALMRPVAKHPGIHVAGARCSKPRYPYLVRMAQGLERISRCVAYNGSDLDCARRPDMSDEKRCIEAPDPNRIDIHDALALHNWSRSLNATPDELRLAVAKVGPFVEKVCEYLRTY